MTHDHDDDDHRERASELSEMQLRVRAIETVLAEKGYVDPAALDAMIEACETACVRTPHGTPIALRPADFAD